MYAAMEGYAALHHHGGAARPLHMGAHFLQKGLQIHDLRLTGGVGDDGSSLCTAGRQHGVLRGSHAGEAQHDLRAGKALPAAGQPSAGLLNGRPHAPQRRKVQVNGPGSQLTAAGIGHFRLSAAGKNGSQKHHRRAHPAHEVIRHIPTGQVCSVHQQVSALPVRTAAQMPQDLHGRLHVPQTGTVPDAAHLPAQKGGCQNGQHAVFGPLHRQTAGEGPPAPDDDRTHMPPPFLAFSPSYAGDNVWCYFRRAMTVR